MEPSGQRQFISEDYRQPVVFAIVVQSLIAVVCLLTLDGGRLARVCGVTMLAFWMAVGLIWCRRSFRPRWSDLAFIRIGFPVLFAATVVVLAAIGRLP